MLRALIALSLTSLMAAPAVADQIDPMPCRPAAASSKLRVTLAPNVSLRDLATWVTGFTCKNVVFASDAERHAPTLNVLAPNAMSPKQATQLFVDALKAAGLVVVQTRDTLIVQLATPRTCGDVATTTPPTDPDRDSLAADLDKGIRVVSTNQREIQKALIDKILADPSGIARGARIVPSIKDGTPNGFKLYAIRPSSIYARLGFMNGDTLHEINGQLLNTPDAVLDVYTKLRGAKRFTIRLTRRGKPVTLVIVVKGK